MYSTIFKTFWKRGWGKIQEIPMYPPVSSRDKTLETQLNPLYAPWLFDRVCYFLRGCFPGDLDAWLCPPLQGLELFFGSLAFVLSQRWQCDFSRLWVSHGMSGPWLWLWGTFPLTLLSDGGAHGFPWPPLPECTVRGPRTLAHSCALWVARKAKVAD